MRNGNRHPLIDRLLDRTTQGPGCWQWTGQINNQGYGVFYVYGDSGRRGTGAHRLVYEALVGPIPDGLQIDHLCRNRACVNPEHMEPVPQTENVRRGVGPTAINKRKTHCVHGHPLTPDNVYEHRVGHRHCRTCAIRRAAEHKQRKRTA